MRCPNCGSEFTGNFCPDCGAPAPYGNDTQMQSAYQPMGQNSYQQDQYGQQQYDQQYNQQQYGQPYFSTPNPAITKRSVATCIILTIITCGIYGIYWFIKLTDDTNMLVNDYGVSNGENLTTGGTAFLLSLVTCGIYSFYWAYKQGERLDRIRAAKGFNQSNLSTTYLLLDIVITFVASVGSIVVYSLMQNELNTLNN